MVFLEWGGTGLLVIAQKVKFVAWAYEYKAGSDHVWLSKALGRLDRRLTVPFEALESSKENKFPFSAPPPGPGIKTRAVCAEGKHPNHLTNTTALSEFYIVIEST